jgi:hypothetical protein
MRKPFGVSAIAGFVGLIIGLTSVTALRAGDNDQDKLHGKNAPTAVGAWFGIARPCPANPITDSPEHAEFCTSVCGACPNIPGVLPPEVPMMPTLLADGTVLADDAGEIPLYHTTAHGKWAVSEKDGLPDRADTQRLKATFFWLGKGPFSGVFDNAVRPRFVTYFDVSDPDRMIGFIQPYYFGAPLNGTFVDITPQGPIVRVTPFDPLNSFAGNHIPSLDPLAPLPAGCQLDKGCLGTYHFVIRRIKAQ